MVKGIDLTGHFSLTSSQAVRDICLPPLAMFGVTYFNYIKVYPDGRRELLATNPDWIQYFYANGLYQTNATSIVECYLRKGFYRWSDLDQDDLIFKQGRELFDIDNGATFVRQEADAMHLYVFASSSENAAINDVYVTQPTVFRRFIHHFHNRAATLLKEAAIHPIHLPVERKVLDVKLDLHRERKDLCQAFYRATPVERFYLSLKDEIYLSPKVAECGALIAMGLGCKQCARILEVSHRVIENRIEQIKHKMAEHVGYKPSREKLAFLLRASGLHEVVFPAGMKFDC